jgi:hypothetical protein
VAERAEADARARTGCVDLSATTCSGEERAAIATIDGYLAEGRDALAGGRYLAAIDAFRSATQRAVELA